MRRVEPKVYLVAQTEICEGGLSSYLESVMAPLAKPEEGLLPGIHNLLVPKWTTDAPSSIEKLIEVMGRMCYRSFAPGLNPNVSRVREGNKTYMDNILKTGHGSILEHGSASFIFADVSRVFTHELVRHRAGTAMSQESLRYVRLEDLGLWIPSDIANNPEAVEIFKKHFELNEKLQVDLAKIFDLDNTADFGVKKKITSAMRRLAPDGLATSIGWTANMRALRHVIELRTSRHAEEEIRLVFHKVAKICAARWPNLFGDFSVETVDGIGEWTTKNHKV